MQREKSRYNLRRLTTCLLAIALALGLAACKHDNGIIKYPTALNNLKQAPHDTTKQDKQAAAQTHTELASVYMSQGHLKEAYKTLHEALHFDDEYIPAHTLLAILSQRIDRPKEADKEYRAAIALNPSNGDTNNNYGVFLCKQGRTRDALKHFKTALGDPFYKTPAWANANAGKCLLKTQQYAEAASYLGKSLQLEPTYGPALLAMAKLDFLKGKAFQARGYLQRFQSAGQASPESLLLGYRIATRLGDKDTATNYSNRLQDQFPDSPQAHSLNGSHP